MTKTNITYFCDDAANRIAELIEEEQNKFKLATRKRDQHRAETAIRAHKESLALVLLERECHKDNKDHPMPNVDAYLKAHQKPPVV